MSPRAVETSSRTARYEEDGSRASSNRLIESLERLGLTSDRELALDSVTRRASHLDSKLTVDDDAFQPVFQCWYVAYLNDVAFNAITDRLVHSTCVRGDDR